MNQRRPPYVVRDRSKYIKVGAPVDHVALSPTTMSLTIDAGPAQTPVDHLVLSPTSVTLDAPPAPATGTMIMGFARTNFGTQPTGSDLTWGWGAPLHRFGWTMSGNSSVLVTYNPNGMYVPYALHHFTEATGQEASDNNTVSWGTLAATWATNNGRNVENIYLHAAVGQQNNKATISSISATGLITLGLNPSSNKQMLAQARAGVAASNAYTIGGTYTITGNSNAAFNTTCTVTAIPSQTTIQTSLSGTAGTGGSIYLPGDGTITAANRMFFESETDWAWVTNPGSQDGKDFQVYRMGQIMSPTDTGVFFDSHFASNMHWQSQEYGTTSNVQYVNDICTLIGLYRSSYPGKLFFPNIANFTSTQDAQIVQAAGGCQQEGALNIFQSGRPNDSLGAFTVAQLAAGVTVILGFTPAFNNVEPHAGVTGLSTTFRAGGAHNYTTVDDRSMMTNFAAAAQLVAAGSPQKFFVDPANQYWAVFPLSARWETGFEVPTGQPVDSLTPQRFMYASGTDLSGAQAHVLGRLFSSDGTTATPFTALILMRYYQGNTTAYDATTAFTVTIGHAPPAGKTWALMNDPGTLTGSYTLGSTIDLWNVDSAIFIPR